MICASTRGASVRSCRVIALAFCCVDCSAVSRLETNWRAAHALADADGMIWIDGGEYTHRDRQVEVFPFYIDETEVTVERFLECVRDGRCQMDDGKMVPSDPELCNASYGEARHAHSINCVTYRQAVEYCAWREARLPTADEWRWVATNRKRQTKWVWGNRKLRTPPRCNPDYAHNYRTCEAQIGDRTIDGIANMGSNVAEWVNVPGANPVFMGLSAKEGVVSEWQRDITYEGFTSHFKSANVGFRCARDAPLESPRATQPPSRPVATDEQA